MRIFVFLVLIGILLYLAIKKDKIICFLSVLAMLYMIGYAVYTFFVI